MDRTQKREIVEQLTESFRGTSTMFVSEFTGLDMPRITDLRDRLREADASFTVVKNTLARRAAADAGLEELTELLHGPTAIAFVRGDAAAVAKALKDFAKEHKDVLDLRGGLMDGVAVDAAQLTEIAELPPREIILAMLLSAVNAPMTQLVGAVNAPMRDIVQVLDAYIQKREAEEGAG